MTLGEFIKNYREEHGKMSVRSFASLVDISPQQIINIEKGIGNDGKPMTSTMKTYRKIAKAIGMDEKDFMNMLNDNVLVNPSDEKIPATGSDGREENEENIIITDWDRRYLAWLHAQSPEKRKAILILQDAPEDLL